MSKWTDAQVWEAKWHGDCINSYWEETKQQVYARKMGLVAGFDKGKFPVYDMENKYILDIGGGAYSLLLKCINVSGEVVDPCVYPDWVHHRYYEAGIKYFQVQGESFNSIFIYDEVWIYNCLQHTQNPKKVIQNAKSCSKIIRLFEWIDNGISKGHLHDLHEADLNEWLGGEGRVEQLNESGCIGKAYYGIFKGNHYV